MDRHLLFLINREWTNPIFDRVLGTLSCMEFWFPVFAVGAVWVVYKYRGRGWRCLLFCAFAVLVNEEAVSQPLKRWTARARPHQSFEGIRRVEVAQVRPRILGAFAPMDVSFSGAPDPDTPNKRSFPSSHTLNATTLGVVFALFFRARLWLILPLLMAWSRVYTGAHWPSDVAASICIGLGVNGLLLLLAERLWRARKGRFSPEFARQNPTFLLPPDTTLPNGNRSVSP